MRVILVLLVVFFPSAAGAAEAFLKGGWLFHVDGDGEIDRNDRWWVGGADWHFASTGLIGFEISPLSSRRDRGKITSRGSHRRSPRRSLEVRLGNVRPYVGGGAGLASALVWTDVAILGFPSDSLGNARSRTRRSRASRSTDAGWWKRLPANLRHRGERAGESVGPDHTFSIAAGLTW
jgi:hypothetical protein